MPISLSPGALVGAILSVTGAGGGILAVPVLVFGMGWSIQQAAPVALVAVAGSAAIGAFEAWLRRMVRYRAALLMTLAGAPIASLGVRAARIVPQRAMLIGFGVIMLFVAARLLIAAAKKSAAHDDLHLSWVLCRVNPKTGRLAWTPLVGISIAATGALSGLMTGLFGVGGGFVIVPILKKITNVSMREVVATSLMVIALVATGSAAVNVAQGAEFPVQFALCFSATVALGMMAGRLVSRRLSSRHVQIGFACIFVCVSFGMVAKALVNG
ncbi:sulfite exporter TauE/SafE family protein [Burkholderia gladioli pv. gladioli]|uniref:Probable membrane transporter protein n=1 Tax=Burkholderia gladioli TaxID=28095 RepID=A0A095F1J4_BURGA|nr:sulfite exporter TauE/SafE family protein [Burkholderia gladioli]AJW97583.1 sulfite exporter TauE/SafE family protein [Burkholderia gladioli]ASD79996.1 anion permease [Burkholderia gladioli pv. gladioli]AWY54757.1 anion permease [Burkholderia gladioli pv. gladioli]KGC10860.1 sulfite exporter TauE/SafE family protein [Burkholderia gladioli]MDJ1164259.1 sulfite exporter TauE/SafE family protein [Burkholderia gladioli pv. gladioli]